MHLEDGKLLLYDAATQQSSELLDKKVLESAAVKPAPAKRFDWQNRRVTEQAIQWLPGGDSVLVAERGDLFLLNVRTKEWSALTATASAERDPKISPDGKQIAFRVEHDLYTMDIESKKTTRLTNDGSENLLNGELDWVYPEELELGTAFWWSPDSSRLAYLQFDTSKIGTYPHADLGSQAAFAEPQKYPQAGKSNSDVRLGVIAAGGGDTKWMDLGDTRQRLIARVEWAGDTLLVQKLPRVQDRLDLVQVDTKSGDSKTILTEAAQKWVNVTDDSRLLPGQDKILWSSERTGFRHLYLYDLDGKNFRPLTSGEWEVSDVAAVDPKKGKVWFTSTEASPLERQFFVKDLEGGPAKRLTEGAGTHSIAISPSGDYYLDTYSSLKTAPVTTLHRGDGARVAVFKEAKPVEFDLLPVEIVQVKTDDGATLYARLIRPSGFDPKKKYPAVVMVYGGPHAQTVRDAWAGANWEQALAQRGFVIWGLDNRGSSARGHAWEAKLYRRFGKQELEDQKKGVDHLTGMGFVDPARIGMYGWSYGGYMTLYSLLNEPDLFAAGIAGAPVTNWHFYDTIYTERYLGLPEENEKGYKESSAITYAENLKAKLLLIHAFGDDNVLFQNSFQMATALQKAGKPFEMMIYPDKSHGVTGPQRTHLNALMTDFFERTLKN